jgi:AmmeMemoRadiSam system protein B
MDAALPRLRPIDAFPVEVEGRRLICLRDPQEYATQIALVPFEAFFILAHLDGRRSALQVQEAYVRRFGTLVTSAEIRELLDTLDRHYFLDSPRFAARRDEVIAAFRAAPVRAAAHAGASYPAEPEALRAHLEGFFADLPPPPADGRGLRGLIAPHIDLRVGGKGYGHAYRTLDAAPEAARFVILGTSHAAGDTLFTATRKDFATPFGPVTTDRDFLDRLAARAPEDLYRDEILHRTEHAVEFQVVLLQHVLGERRPFTVVPLLVTSFHEMIQRRASPAADPRVAGFLAALRATLAEDDVPTVLVAGVDFAHVGQKFGDREGLDPALLAAAEAKDRRLIAALEAADPENFFREIAADGDRTRICGFAPMYTFLSVIDGARGRLLHYDRTRDETTRSSVSYASLAYGAGAEAAVRR